MGEGGGKLRAFVSSWLLGCHWGMDWRFFKSMVIGLSLGDRQRFR